MPVKLPEFGNIEVGCLKRHNENPQPLVWSKSLGEIMVKVERGRATLADASK